MQTVPRSFVDKDEVVAAMRASAADVVYAIRKIKDPSARAVGTWSAGEVAAHLIDVAEDGRLIGLGEGTRFSTPELVAKNNESRLAERAERDPQTLADLNEKAWTEYADTLAAIDGDPLIPWMDYKIPVSALAAVELAECLVHGFDIARSQGESWEIDPGRAVLSARGISPVTEHYVDPEAAAGFTGTFDLKLRGYQGLHFVFLDGSLTIEDPGPRKVDVHISADPVAFMLVGYGRISQWGPMATGKLLAYGRKPWLALKFASLLKQP